MKRSALIHSFIIFSLALVFPLQTHAETVGSTISVPITFTASEAVTAADFTLSISSNGQIQSISCGGSGFSSLSSNGNQCVVFNPSGATSGTLATATVVANSAGTLTVTATGTLSTAGGVAPSSGQISGQTYTITGSGGSTSTGTTTPTRTPSPTPIGALPSSGSVSTTMLFTLIVSGLLGTGFFLFRRI